MTEGFCGCGKNDLCWDAIVTEFGGPKPRSLRKTPQELCEHYVHDNGSSDEEQREQGYHNRERNMIDDEHWACEKR